MFLLSVYIIVSGLVGGWLGQDRKIGFWGGFVVSVLLGIIGWIIVAYSKKVVVQKPANQVTQLNGNIHLTTSSTGPGQQSEINVDLSGSADPLTELNNLKQSGFLTDAEYNDLKSRLK